MTELIPAPAEHTALALIPDAGTELILRAVQQMEGASRLGAALASTAFVPAAFRGKPDDAAAAIMYGAAIGMDPMSSLRAIYVVGGNPGMYARQMVAIAVSKGHRIWTVESTDQSVTVSGQRRGSDVVETVTWTGERARRAGYTSNKKYETDPQAMLWARAAGDVARRIAPDALAGLDYSVEELQVIEHEDVTPCPRRESAASLLQATARVVEPEPEPAAEPRLQTFATSAQVTAIYTGMSALGYDRDVAKQVAAKILDRLEVASMKDLSRDEAGTLLDAIAQRQAATHAPAYPTANSTLADEYPAELALPDGDEDSAA